MLHNNGKIKCHHEKGMCFLVVKFVTFKKFRLCSDFKVRANKYVKKLKLTSQPT